jgi:hypothetical protein
MNPVKQPAFLISFIAAFVAAMSFTSGKEKLSKVSRVMIQFETYVGNERLKMNTTNYQNEYLQYYTVSKFRYYICQIQLTNKNGKNYFSNAHYLVNEDEADSHRIVLNDVPEGAYTSIAFTVGVDSLHNCSGLQQGALDPVNGMFWAWNTGYVFLKLEGTSPASTAPGNIFEFHIGGYRLPHNCIREINLKLKEDLEVSAAGTAIARIKTDVAEILKTPVAINFATLSSVTDFNNATLIADNYRDMFSVISVAYQYQQK